MKSFQRDLTATYIHVDVVVGSSQWSSMHAIIFVQNLVHASPTYQSLL